MRGGGGGGGEEEETCAPPQIVRDNLKGVGIILLYIIKNVSREPKGIGNSFCTIFC